MTEGFADYGALGLAAGLSFAIARESLQVLHDAVKARRDDGGGVEYESYSGCPLDQAKLTAIHDTVSRWDRNLGQFSCTWRDRDEVRDMLEALRSLSTQISSLTELIRAEQNGRSNGG